jgi:hypothetical protein
MQKRVLLLAVWLFGSGLAVGLACVSGCCTSSESTLESLILSYLPEVLDLVLPYILGA